MKRREFIEKVGYAGLGLMAGCAHLKGKTPEGKLAERPNIIFIMSDEHDKNVASCYGDPIVQTPNLDRLAENGIVFENCYTTSPLCVPARLSFTCGKYVSRNGAYNNHCWLKSDDIVSLPRILQEQGYETPLAGKMHFDPSRRYGFDELTEDLWTNQYFKNGKGYRRPADAAENNVKSWNARKKSFHSADSSRTMDHDREVTKVACEYLRNRKAENGNFMLTVGYLAPHFPLAVPQEYYDRYKDKVPMPEIPEGLELPKNYKQVQLGFGVIGANPADVKKGRECYWALVNWMDDQIGELLAALDNSDVADNTIVIYTSDHGENKGDHGMWWKSTMYEHAAAVDLIVSWPKRWTGGQRRIGACSHLDIVQTIADLAGAKVPRDWDGESLLPWMDDKNYQWKDFALCEYHAHFIHSGITMVRQGKYKYTYHGVYDPAIPAELELFNMEADPKEFNNLADDPKYKDIVADLHQKMLDELGETPEQIEKRVVADITEGYGRQKPKDK